MFDATSPYEAPAAETAATLQRGRGAAEIVFTRRGARTVLSHLYQQTPCRVLFPHGERGDPPLAVLLTTSGGLTGGDAIRLDIALDAGAEAQVTTQAAEKLYRSLGPATTIEIDIAVGEGARLDYLPQETILFNRARLDRRTRIAVAAGGKCLAAEMLVFGRAARGETMTSGHVYDSWRVRRAGRLVWADALVLDGDIAAELRDPFILAGGDACATALYIGDDAAALLPQARALADGAASLVGGVLVARLFGGAAQDIRARLVRYLAGLRDAMGLTPRLPALWHT